MNSKKKICCINLAKIILIGILYFLFEDAILTTFQIDKEYPVIIQFIKQLMLSCHNVSLIWFYYLFMAILDFCLLIFLMKIVDTDDNVWFCYYVLSLPIIFSSYFILEFDMLAILFLVASIEMMFKSKNSYSAVLMALAILSKTPAIISLPFISLYLYKTNLGLKRYEEVMRYFSTVMIAVVGIALISQGQTNGNFGNIITSISLVTSSYYNIGELKIYLAPLALLLLYARFASYRKVNKQLLLDFIGLSYTIFVILIMPEAHWYLWSVVFISILFAKQGDKNKKILYLYWILSAIYIFYFICIDGYSTLKVFDVFRNSIFTVFEGIMLAVCYVTYKLGIKSNNIYHSQKDAIIIGIGGDSGSGKTTLKKSIISLLDKNRIADIEADGDHKWERGDEKWDEYTHLNPKANYLYKQANYLKELKKGIAIKRVDYDHSSGKFTDEVKVNPKDYILVAGLHPFYLPQMRRLVDIKIYLDTDEKLRRHWKIIRDTEKRGYSIERILHQIEGRIQDANKYIYPQKQFSDIIIKYFSSDDYELGDQFYNPKINLEMKIRADIDLDDLIREFISKGIDIKHDFDNDLKYQIIILDRPIDKSIIQEHTLKYIENIEEIANENQIDWNEGYYAFIQMIILIVIANEMMGETKYEI